MIGKQLSDEALAYRHLELDICESTNNICLDYAHRGEPSNLWVTAQQQTAGKASRGRKWISQNDNLFASLLLRDPAPVTHLAQLTFVAAISVGQAISEYLNEGHISYKWPNDVLVNDRKCSGILLESQILKGETIVIIGIGINCKNAPSETLFPATSLQEAGIVCGVENLFHSLANSFASNISLWEQGKNFETIRNKWFEKVHGLGKPVTVQIPGQGIFKGIFEDIDADGHLLLKLENGDIHKVSSADIFFN